MPISQEEFTSWCFRNGGETFEEQEGPGIACRFPDATVSDRVHYFPDTQTFDVITMGIFYSTRSMNQHADSWIDEEDKLHIDTEDARLIVNPV